MIGSYPISRQELQTLRESEARFRTLVAGVADIVFSTDAEGYLTESDPALQGSAAWGGRDWTDLLHPEDHAQAIAGWQSALRDPRPWQTECRLSRPDGAWRWIRVYAAPLRDVQGGVTAWAGMMTDITEARALQQELIVTRRRFELALVNSPVTLFEQDLELRYRWVYNMPKEFPAAAIIGRTDAELLAPEAAAPIDALKRRVIASGKAEREEVVAFATGYRPARFDLCVEPRCDPSGAIVGVMCVAVDITARKRAEAALRASEERFRQLFEQSADGIFVANASGRYLDVNPAGCSMLGYTHAQMLALTFEDVIAPDDFDRLAAHVENLADGEIQVTEWHFLRRDRTTFYGEIMCRQLPDGWFLGVVRDVTQRRQAHDTLLAARDALVKLVDHSPFGIYLVDHEFRLVQVSDGAQKVFESVRPLIGRDLGEVLRLVWAEPFASEAIARFRHTLATGEPYTAQTSNLRAGRESTEAYDWRIERITMPDGHPGVVCNFYDLTERNRQEERVQLLLHELNHRAKNMLQLVDIVARRTAATRPQDFVASFSRRIRSLAANQDLLVSSDWRPISLDALIRAQLAHFGGLLDTRIIIAGPSCKVTPVASQTLAMAVHELATNAAKYGSLSNEHGRVEIHWDLRPGVDGAPRFGLSWVETGGPPASPPENAGFGSTVIGEAVRRGFNGEVTSDFAPTGFSWRMNCPADAILDRSASPHAK